MTKVIVKLGNLMFYRRAQLDKGKQLTIHAFMGYL